MAKSGDEDEQAIDRLTLYMLKETYCAAAGALMRMNPSAADALFQAFERQIAEALQRMHAQRSEGPDSTAIALAVGDRIAEILEQAHRRQFEPATAPGPEDRSLKAVREAGISSEAVEILADLQRRFPSP
ncbi:hypothetical protein ABEV34_15930 [Methylorubrum rhodesianum]|jgi:hypothetical protein|uniref:hypothetical protein n=1 Tax=Methylorubrum TaxID=2282523 RepID=UPI000349F106|nr:MULTISPECIES: hypothetical protein [Methylorubrum]MBB5761739.1 hypothetical protein [Methylorubrum rhodesianum]MBI1687615.1 hypothetical protein [Methylorubrum sp. DB1722]